MKKLVSILVPAYNEAEAIEALSGRLRAVMDRLTAYDFEVLFVDDGSRDDTLKKIQAIRNKDARVCFVKLSRNFGKEIAMAAGFDHLNPATDAMIILDADLQHPPEVIEQMLQEWEGGYDDVYARRRSREGESWLRTNTSRWYYRILAAMSRVPIQTDTGDFRLLSRRAIQALRQLRETQRYTKGLFSLIGFRKRGILYDPEPRFAGETKWSYWKLCNLAIEGITSFTVAPLRLASLMGFFVSLLAFAWMAKVLLKALIYGDPVVGYPSLMTVVLFLGSVQLVCLGVIGEYIGRIFWETKNRPLYFIDEYEGNARKSDNEPGPRR